MIPDKYTDSVLNSYGGCLLSEPVLPGRGMGVSDVPGLKLLRDSDPKDIVQGGVGDCWLLSAISVRACSYRNSTQDQASACC